MKKALSLILCMIFVFSFAACKEKEEKSAPVVSTVKHNVDVKKLVDEGVIDTIDYKLGDDVETVKTALSQITDEHGDSGFDFNDAWEEYVTMSADGVFCRYEKDEESEGISVLAVNDGAFGFTKGMIPTKVSDAMKSLGYSTALRDVKDGEFFFLPKGTEAGVLEYRFDKNNLAFVFIEDGLSFTVIYK